jgi:branched-chain amino acid aminotransferase
MVIPVSDYYAGGLSSPVDGILVTQYDRAAPRGVGDVKVAGNYAADLYPNMKHKKMGYPISLYLDAKTQTCIEEFSTSNFVGISHRDKKYLTPKSPSVLPSITNKSLMTIAQDMGYMVEQRDIPLEELETMDEVLACGTAVVVTPVGSIARLDEASGQVLQQYTFGNKDRHNGEETNASRIGEMTRALYNRVRAIQFGEAEDKWGWNVKVE